MLEAYQALSKQLEERRGAELAPERRGQHAVWGEQTVRTMLRILALHDKMHTQDVSKLVSPEP